MSMVVIIYALKKLVKRTHTLDWSDSAIIWTRYGIVLQLVALDYGENGEELYELPLYFSYCL